jgi:hypothetical protein
MFPTEPALDLWFERNIFGGIPLIQQGIRHQGFIETENQVTEGLHFSFGIGITQGNCTTITGGYYKHNRHPYCNQCKQGLTHIGLKLLARLCPLRRSTIRAGYWALKYKEGIKYYTVPFVDRKKTGN